MAATVATVAHLGLEARSVEAQAELSAGLPRFTTADLAGAVQVGRIAEALGCRRQAPPNRRLPKRAGRGIGRRP